MKPTTRVSLKSSPELELPTGAPTDGSDVVNATYFVTKCLVDLVVCAAAMKKLELMKHKWRILVSSDTIRLHILGKTETIRLNGVLYPHIKCNNVITFCSNIELSYIRCVHNNEFTEEA